ncbi:MAG: glycosyltransferase involved in cell wall biosynthesis [Kiritimatiellia bacterium]|jgi:glycosyltransferase involved in cell wall biosynthesis
MKVLHINDHLAWKGGVETYLLNLIPLLEKRGVQNHVLYGTGTSETPILEASESLPALAQPGDDAEVAREVRARIQAFGADLVHLHGIGNLGVYRAALDTAPVVMTSHDYRPICPASTFFYKRTKRVCQRTCGPACFAVTLRHHCLTPRPKYAAAFYQRSRWVMEHAKDFASLIAPSAAAADRYRAAGFSNEQVKVIPYFCPIAPADVPRPIPEVPMLTYMGRITPNKGWEHFVDALGRLPPHVHGRMIGASRPEHQAAIAARAQAAGCADRLEVISWASREEIERYVLETSILVFPSIWPETLGIVGLEAFARGVPVIASDIGGVGEWLEDGVNGHAVKPGSGEAIAVAAEALLADTARMTRYGAAGLDTIRQRFMPEQHLEKLCSVYEAACSSQVA